MGKYAIGLDIGTTTISAIVLDIESGELCRSVTVSNDTFIQSAHAWERMQDANAIAEKALAITANLVETFHSVCSIGVTGQMHGILYLNRKGNAISPLYTWQDQRAEITLPSGNSACKEIRAATGYTIRAGYGIATHYANMKLHLVPDDAASFCTIHDYIVMLLTGRTLPVTHASDGASLGIYDLRANAFDYAALKQIGIDPAMLPEVTVEETVAGYYNAIPVCSAIGDNQAAFLGSVSDIDNDMLINIGTGSQISYATDYCENNGDSELRPLTGNKYIAAGSALCGGRAYASLETFFRDFVNAAGIPLTEGTDHIYAVMAKLAREAAEDCGGLTVDPRFAGSRAEPTIRGSIKGIDIANFTPGNLIRATLLGMNDELYQFVSGRARPARLIGSGNAIRKNPLLAEIIEKRFGTKLLIPKHREEAAFGAALLGMTGSQICDFRDIGKYIQYHL